MKLIDADLFASTVFELSDKRNMTTTTETILDIIKYMATIDAVVVCRCKNCEHSCEIVEMPCFYWCKLFDRPVDDTDYCSCGRESR